MSELAIFGIILAGWLVSAALLARWVYQSDAPFFSPVEEREAFGIALVTGLTWPLLVVVFVALVVLCAVTVPIRFFMTWKTPTKGGPA